MIANTYSSSSWVYCFREDSSMTVILLLVRSLKQKATYIRTVARTKRFSEISHMWLRKPRVLSNALLSQEAPFPLCTRRPIDYGFSRHEAVEKSSRRLNSMPPDFSSGILGENVVNQTPGSLHKNTITRYRRFYDGVYKA